MRLDGDAVHAMGWRDGMGNGKVEWRARMRSKLYFERDVYVAYCTVALHIMITPSLHTQARKQGILTPLGVILALGRR